MQWAYLMTNQLVVAQRKSQWRVGSRTLLPITLLTIFSTTLVGCYPVKSQSEVVGLYELHVGHDKISLAVSADQSYAETIQWASGKVEKRVGRWYWNRGSVSFEGLWIPKAFAPDYIEQADAQSPASQPKYTEPGTWAVSAEHHWGKITLTVFPDADIDFKMVSHSPGDRHS
jgi:hypothetical protein